MLLARCVIDCICIMFCVLSYLFIIAILNLDADFHWLTLMREVLFHRLLSQYGWSLSVFYGPRRKFQCFQFSVFVIKAFQCRCRPLFSLNVAPRPQLCPREQEQPVRSFFCYVFWMIVLILCILFGPDNLCYVYLYLFFFITYPSLINAPCNHLILCFGRFSTLYLLLICSVIFMFPLSTHNHSLFFYA